MDGPTVPGLVLVSDWVGPAAAADLLACIDAAEWSRELKRRGTTVILVSHRPTLVQGVDKVLLMRDGAVEAFGPRAEVLKRLMQQARPAEVTAGRVEGGAR